MTGRTTIVDRGEDTSKIVAHNEATIYAMTAEQARRGLASWTYQEAHRPLAYAEGAGLVLGELVPRQDVMWCARRGFESLVLGVRPWPDAEPKIAGAICEAIRWDWRLRVANRQRDRGGAEVLSDAQVGDLAGVLHFAHLTGRVATVVRAARADRRFRERAQAYCSDVRGWLQAIADGATCGVVPPSASLFIEGAVMYRARGTMPPRER